MSEIRILKCKLVKKGEALSVEYSRQERDKSITIVSEEHKAPVHTDLKNAFLGVAIHFAILSDYVKVKQVKDIRDYDSDLIEGFNVSTIHRGGAEDEEYIILTGSKITATGRAVTINTPILKIEEEGDKGYKYIEQLIERVAHVESEVKEYLSGKHAPDPQGELNFDQTDGNKITRANILPANTPAGVVKEIVDEVNGKVKPAKNKRVPQSATNKDGLA